MQPDPEKETARQLGGTRAVRKNKHHHYNHDQPDFKAINRAAMAVLPALLRRLLPGGKGIGHEWVALNPRRADHRAGSFKVNMRSGCWADFATGDKGGDVISLAAYIFNIRQGEAARRIAAMLGGCHDC